LRNWRNARRQKRPADVIGNVIRVAKLATGEIEKKPLSLYSAVHNFVRMHET
jgi:hypothetical protein